MERRYLNDGLLDDARVFSATPHNESDLFVKEDKLLKILLKKKRTKQREETIIKLNEFESDECCLPEFLICESPKKDTSSGFGMTYYEDYSELIKLINSLTFKERFIIAKKIILLMESFEDLRYTYIDLHSRNILIKGTDIKLVDMDGGCFRSIIGNELYRMLLSASYNELTQYVILLLYNIDCFSYKEFFSKNLNIFKRNSNRKQYKMITVASEGNSRIFHPSDCIDSFTEEYINETKPLLILTQ